MQYTSAQLYYNILYSVGGARAETNIIITENKTGYANGAEHQDVQYTTLCSKTSSYPFVETPHLKIDLRFVFIN